MVERASAGTYTCHASSKEGTITHTTRVLVQGRSGAARRALAASRGLWHGPQVPHCPLRPPPAAGPPVIVVPPQNVTVNISQDAFLACQAEAYPGNLTYTWFQGSSNVFHLRYGWGHGAGGGTEVAAGSWRRGDLAESPTAALGHGACRRAFTRPGCLLPPSLPPSPPLAATSRPGCASWWTGASCCSEPPRTTPANTPASPATGSGSHLQPQPSSRCCVRARGCPHRSPWGPQSPPSTPRVPPRSGAGDHHAPGDPFAQGDAGRDPVPHQGQPPPALRQLDTGRAPAGAGQGTTTHGPPTPSPAPHSPPKSPPCPSHQLPGWSARPDGSIVIATGNDDALGVYTCTPYNSYGTAGASRPTRVLLKVGTDWGGDRGHNTPVSLVPATVPSTVRGSCRTPPPSPCAPRRNTSRRWAGSWWSPAWPMGTPHPPSPGGR